MQLPVVVTVPQHTIPALPGVPGGELRHLVALWEKCVPHLQGEGGDFEDWVESAYRILGAVEAVGARNVWVQTRAGLVTSALDGSTLLLSELGEHLECGMLPGGATDLYHPSTRLASEYMLLETFQRHAGRDLELAGILTGDEHDGREAVKRLRARGAEKLVVKGRESKSIFTVVHPEQSLEDALGEDQMWAMVYREGDRDALLVQEWVRMRYEYRCFVVGHEVTTSAGAVQEHTPLQNAGEQHSPLLREHRDTRSQVVHLPEVRDQLVGFAEQVAGELTGEAPEMREYVLDVALDGDGEPLLVELNSLPNAGYYAADPKRLMRARLTARPTAPFLPGTRQRPQR